MVIKMGKERRQSWEIANRLHLFDEAIHDGYDALLKVEEEIEQRIKLGDKIDKEKILQPIKKQINKFLREKKRFEKKRWIAE